MGDGARVGLLRGTPPYPWWQWFLVGSGWAVGMFLIFNLLTGFRAVVLNAVLWPIGGAIFALWTRQRIVRRERRAGRLPAARP
jgi:hypothetical protein